MDVCFLVSIPMDSGMPSVSALLRRASAYAAAPPDGGALGGSLMEMLCTLQSSPSSRRGQLQKPLLVLYRRTRTPEQSEILYSS